MFINIAYPQPEINEGFNSMLDMFCLSKCKRIYQGIKWSSFSGLSALIGSVDIINYYNLLPQYHSNYIYAWKSVIKVNGKIDYAEYENIGSNFIDIKIKYINTNNMLFNI